MTPKAIFTHGIDDDSFVFISYGSDNILITSLEGLSSEESRSSQLLTRSALGEFKIKSERNILRAKGTYYVQSMFPDITMNH